jgi:acetyl esterase/lipase
MRVFIFAWTALLAAFASLHFYVGENLHLWQLSIVVSEFGQWFAVLSLLTLSLLSGTKLPWLLSAFCTATLASIFVVFLAPTLQLALNFPVFSKDLENAFGAPLPTAHLPHWRELWLGSLNTEKVEPKRFVYAKDGGVELSLDFYRAPHAEKAPLVIIVHGGGWNSGASQQLPELNSHLANLGFAVASVDYRLAPLNQWPAPRQDILKAVEFLRTRALEFGIDPVRWAILGRSAGGQIAAAIAYQSVDPALKGCILFYAPTEMNIAYDLGKEDDILGSRPLVRNYMGGNPESNPPLYKDASPLAFVTEKSPPTLILHGAKDILVSPVHSKNLFARLQEARVASAYIELPWATHGFDWNIHGPGGQMSTYAVDYFLKRIFQ